MHNTLRLEVITPDGPVYSDEVESVTVQGVEGQITILPNHVRLMAQLAPGEMIARKERLTTFLAVGEGLAAITGNRVAVITDMAVTAENIDEAKVEEARQRAAARLRDKISSEEVASVNASIARALAQLNVKRRRHN